MAELGAERAGAGGVGSRGLGAIAVAGHSLELMPDGGRFLDAFDADVARATRRVLVECYIVRDDRLGHWLGDRLAAAAARGLDVRLIYDPLGSQKAAAGFFAELARRGVRVHPYWAHHRHLPRGAPFPRDHGRVIVIDDVGYTGGAAWAQEWLPAARGGGDWYDVCVRVAGAIAKDFAALFELRFAEAAGERHGATDFDSGTRHRDLRLIGDTPRRVSLVCEAHLEAIARARRRIWMANAYFYPPAAMLAELAAAAARGVDVQIVVPRSSDLPIVERAGRARYRRWLAAGLALHEYVGRMMHAKYAVIDDGWATVGSFNALPISVGLANEVNLVCTDPGFVAVVADQFARDRGCGEAITPATYAGRSWLTRAIDRLASWALALTDRVWGPRRGPR